MGGNLVLLTGGGGNVVALGGPEGALLVDGGSKARSGTLLKVALKSVGAKKLHTLFNTHWHPDQTGSNEYAGKQGARIIAQENTRSGSRARSSPTGCRPVTARCRRPRCPTGVSTPPTPSSSVARSWPSGTWARRTRTAISTCTS